MVRAKVVGAGGYGGVGIIELLLAHPEAEIACLVGVSDVGKTLGELWPHLDGFLDAEILSMDDPRANDRIDVVFMSTPDGVGMDLAGKILDDGAKVIDFSGDFRFNTPEAYADYAGRVGRDQTHSSPDLLPDCTYGLAELHRAEINEKTKLVGNPGCFAVSCILGLTPAVKGGLVNTKSIICDCKTGVSGAGKKPSPTFHYPVRYDTMNAYKLAGHQHVCEIERELNANSDEEVMITFTSQVIPLCRGIMSTLYADLKSGMTEEDVLAAYRDCYSDDPFVRVYPSSAPVTSAHVRGSNYCNLVVSVDERTGRLRVVSYIDNLVKGQAGNALQNMNLLFGLAETAGLDRPSQCP